MDDALANAHGFVGEDGEAPIGGVEGVEHFAGAGVERGFVEAVLVVVANEEVEGAGDVVFGGFGAEGAAHEDGRAVADVRGDDGGIQSVQVHEAAGGVDGGGEIGLGVDEGAVEIEDNE